MYNGIGDYISGGLDHYGEYTGAPSGVVAPTTAIGCTSCAQSLGEVSTTGQVFKGAALTLGGAFLGSLIVKKHKVHGMVVGAVLGFLLSKRMAADVTVKE